MSTELHEPLAIASLTNLVLEVRACRVSSTNWRPTLNKKGINQLESFQKCSHFLLWSYWMGVSAAVTAGWTTPGNQQCCRRILGLKSQYLQPAEKIKITITCIHGHKNDVMTWGIKCMYLQHQLLNPASSMNPQQREEQFEMANTLRLRTWKEKPLRTNVLKKTTC